jgi:predicted ATP-grasp superfamily ATP-dependent carboligase
MRILITGARAPVALELVRLLAQSGHQVWCADSLPISLAGSSRFAQGYSRTPSARYERSAFGRSLIELVQKEKIDLLIPTCEEVFYVAAWHKQLSKDCQVWCEPINELWRWHHKGEFQRYAASLGVRTPRTRELHSRQELLDALADFPRYLLKPAFSRFSQTIISNCIAKNGLTLEDCQPSKEQPWLIQEFIDGDNECSYSVVHNGQIHAHCAYRIPASAQGGAGSAFQSVDGQESLTIAQRLASSAYNGQLSLDFIRTPKNELVVLECNPRTTSAAHVMDSSQLAKALVSQQGNWLEPAGSEGQVGLATIPALLGQTVQAKFSKGARKALQSSLTRRDVIWRSDDPQPYFSQIPLFLYFLRLARQKRISIFAATTDDLEWNGDADLFTTELA